MAKKKRAYHSRKAPAIKLKKIGRAPGRKSNYNADRSDDLAYNLCLMGATNKQLGEAFGVAERTVEGWLKNRKNFRAAVHAGREIADARVARGMFEHAIGYEHDDVKIMQNEGKPIYAPFRKHYPPDTAAGKFWLTNRQGDKWKEHSSQEVFGKNGGKIEVHISGDDTRL